MLERLAAETRADDAAASRRRTAWLGRQAEEEATFAGVLLDLADRDRAVVLHTQSGRVHRGWIEAVGTDFVGVRTATGHRTFLRLDTVATVRGQQAEVDTTGDRPLVVEADLTTLLRSLGPSRPRVVLVVGSGGASVSGELRWVGLDVLAVRLDGGSARTYVPLTAITEVGTTDDVLP